MLNASVRFAIRTLMAAASPVLAASCVNNATTAPPPPPATYLVSYGLSGTAGIAFDSVKYENEHEGVITVVAPPIGWSVSVVAPAGAYAHAAVWARALTGGQSMTLTATWTAAGRGTTDRSTIVEIATLGPFGVDIGRTRL